MAKNPFPRRPAPQTIVVKVGTRALLDQEGMLDEAVFTSIVDQIAVLKQGGFTVFLVTSGAVGTGRAIMGWPENKVPTLVQKQGLAAIGQHRLMNMYDRLFTPTGLIPSQLLLEREHFMPNGNNTPPRQDMVNHISLLSTDPAFRHVVPIINENDAVATRELAFTDNDELASLLAGLVRAKKLIILSHIDGIYTSDPTSDPAATLVREINFADATAPCIDTSGVSSTGRGGMAGKHKATFDLLRACGARARALSADRCGGCEVYIANARKDDVILSIVEGGKEIGTRLVCRPVLQKEPGTRGFSSSCQCSLT